MLSFNCSICVGDLIILVAQIIQAVQVVVEEKFVNGKDIHPLQAVGWEGQWQGFLDLPLTMNAFVRNNETLNEIYNSV